MKSNGKEYCDECHKTFGTAEKKERVGRLIFHQLCFVTRILRNKKAEKDKKAKEAATEKKEAKYGNQENKGGL